MGSTGAALGHLDHCCRTFGCSQDANAGPMFTKKNAQDNHRCLTGDSNVWQERVTIHMGVSSRVYWLLARFQLFLVLRLLSLSPFRDTFSIKNEANRQWSVLVTMLAF